MQNFISFAATMITVGVTTAIAALVMRFSEIDYTFMDYLPFFILSMRNGIAVMTILRYHVFFELSRFLVGSIGVVLAIPISGFLAAYYYQHRRKAKTC